MKSIIEDFDHIAMRLNEIAQEKHREAKPEELADGSAQSWMGVMFTPSGDDVYC